VWRGLVTASKDQGSVDMTDGMGGLIFGGAMLVFSGVIWSGLVKPPLDSAPGMENVAWTVMPTGGILFCVVGLRVMHVIPEGSPLGQLAFVLAVVGIVLYFWDPPWWGPRWYRERE